MPETPKNRAARWLSAITKGIGLLGGIVGLLGGIAGLVSFWEGRRAERRQLEEQRALKANQVDSLLDEAWDLMGGAPGSTYIDSTVVYTADELQKLELANRKIASAGKLAPNDSRVLWQTAVVKFKRAQFGEAERYLRNIAARHVPNVHPYLLLGVIHRQQCKYAVAVEDLTAAVREDPKNAPAYDNLGIALYGAGRLDEARANFAKAIELEPLLESAHNNLGLMLLKRGDVPQAIESFNTAIRINPRFAIAHKNLGDAYERLGRRAEAKDERDRAAKLGYREEQETCPP